MCGSFFATLERELPDRGKLRTRAEVRMAVFELIEGWYHPGRHHFAPGYKSPIDSERSARSKLRRKPV